MGRKRMLGRLLMALLWSGINLFLGLYFPRSTTPAHAFSLAQQAQPTPPGPSPDALVGAFATIVAALLTALIAAIVVIYQMRKNNDQEHKNKQKQSQLDTALQRQQRQAELEKMHLFAE